MTKRPALTHRLRLDEEIGVTFVTDGAIHLPHSLFLSGGPPNLWTENPEYLDADGLLVMSLGGILVETNTSKTLIDLGIGPVHVDVEPMIGMAGSMVGGDLITELNKLNIGPNDIDAVLLSHLHVDHIGWLVTETASGPELTFARAEHFVSKVEHQLWEDPANAERPGGPTAVQLAALNEARLTYLEDGSKPVPGIAAMFTPGHSPGHCCFVIGGTAARAIVLGDCMHCPVQISHPELAGLSDADIELGKVSRDQLQRELDRPNTVCVAPHFPECVFGRVETLSGARRFVSLEGGDAVAPRVQSPDRPAADVVVHQPSMTRNGDEHG